MALHLTVSLAGAGYHPAAWHASPLPARPDVVGFQAMARTAERGRLDAILLGLPIDAPAGGIAKANTMQFDPLPLLGGLTGVTRQIGLGAAWTVDYTEPYNVARVFATLDHLSYGRTAWIARMFGTAALAPRIGRPAGPDDADAYCARAGEFVDVVKKLWDSWEDEAFALDKPSGTFVDPDRVHVSHHAGPYFTVRGPLNLPRPPQGNPVLVLETPAGTIARRFAAAIADVLLTSCATLPEAVARYRELHALAVDGGRRADAPVIFSNMMVLLDETEAAAQARAAALDALVLPGATVPRFVGTPDRLVETLLAWHGQKACDGFNLLPAVLPTDLDRLVDTVMPLLRRGGVFRGEYVGSTLRAHLGLARPRSQYADCVTEQAGP